MIYLIFVFLFCIFLFFYIKMSKEFTNPYDLNFFFGLPGCGKTTLMVKDIIEAQGEGWICYCNVPVTVPGVRLFKIKDYGHYYFPPNSTIFVDEVGTIWDNRQFKNFTNEVRDYFKFYRHRKNRIRLYSQSFDVDLKIRSLCTGLYMIRRVGPLFSIAHRVSKKIVVVEPQGDSEGRIADGYALDPIWLSLFGRKVVRFTYLPKYSQYFDSFDNHEELLEMPYIEVPMPEPKESRNPLKTFFRRKANVPKPEQNDLDYENDFKDIS